jgi:proteasome lid subunit RPN8/RPN11
MKNIEEFKTYVLSKYPEEACGVIVEEVFYAKENIHPSPLDNFMFSQEDTVNLLDIDYSIIHSHTANSFKVDPRTPSFEDMVGRENTQVPWGIVHCDGESVTDILYFGQVNTEKLVGRDYISNVFDCFTLARDFFYKEFSIDIGLHPRPSDWEEWNPHYISHNYSKTGFTEQTGELEFGDILLFSISSRQINHIGIYLEPDKFIHHLHSRKSSEDSISRWSKHLVKTIRLVK